MLSQFLPVFKALHTALAVEQMQFHTPPTTSFLRLHKPEKFGDDLSSFRATVAAANRETRPVRGLESGVAGFGIRGVHPVRHAGRHVGSVEIGLSFGQPFFERFKAQNGVEVALHLSKSSGFETFAGTARAALLDAQDLRTALEGQPVVRYRMLGATPVAVYARAIGDYQGRPVGVVEIARDRSTILDSIASARDVMLALAAITLVVGIVMAVWIGNGIARPIRSTAHALRQIADGDGDLSRRLPAGGMRELQALSSAFNRFLEKITGIVASVRSISQEVAVASREIAAGNNELATRNERQATATEETAASIEAMSTALQRSAGHAHEANELAAAARDQAEQGKRIAVDAVDAMETLERSSHQIADIIGIIDEIAFQTNLLALNASVEAAHAGEHGRGFAVVAHEVRALAGRSAEAAQQIKKLILGSDARVREGVARVERFRDLLESVADQVRQMSAVVAHIASAAAEQSSGIQDIRRAIDLIETSTMQNTAMVEQIATTSQSMAEQAARLDEQVGRFRLSSNAAGPNQAEVRGTKPAKRAAGPVSSERPRPVPRRAA